jgi:hypothetical protein
MATSDDPRAVLLFGLYGQGVLDLEQVRRWGVELGLSRDELRRLLGRCVAALLGDDEFAA